MSSTAANGTATTGDGTTGTVKATPVDNSAHEAIASWFLGPKAENTQYLRDAVDFIVSDMQKSRQNYHPEDMVCLQSFDVAGAHHTSTCSCSLLRTSRLLLRSNKA